MNSLSIFGEILPFSFIDADSSEAELFAEKYLCAIFIWQAFQVQSIVFRKK